MLDDDNDQTTTPAGDPVADPAAAPAARTRRRAVSRPAGPPASGDDQAVDEAAAVEAAPARKTAAKKAAKKATKKTAAKKAAKKTAAKKRTAKTAEAEPEVLAEASSDAPEETPAEAPVESTTPTVTTTSTTRRRASRPAAAPAVADLFSAPQPPAETPAEQDEDAEEDDEATAGAVAAEAGAAPVFQAPETTTRRRSRKRAEPQPDAADAPSGTPAETADDAGTATDGADDSDDSDDSDDEGTPSRRRRRRGGRRRRKGSGDGSGDVETDGESSADAGDETSSDDAPQSGDDDAEGEGSSRRRRRRRRRGGGGGDDSGETRSAEDEITSVSGSTRLEAKKQRRREGREAGRRRAPIVSEAEFLARRESVKRQMVIRQRQDLTQIAVMEDDVLVEHYVARESQSSLIGNVYLGRVQNVLPSMEAAFVDIGKGRNAVLYAGEVDWKALGDGKQRRIEEVLKSGQHVLVQVTKDPIGHKGARLTSQISLAGRFLVYVPRNHTSGISRKLPDVERNRLKGLLKDVLPEDAGVIIRTAAEGATEEQLTRDVSALTARWEDIERKAAAGGKAPQLLYGEPDLMIKVVRDLFNEDFESLVVEGDDAWDMVQGYVQHVAPDLGERLTRWDAQESGTDSFAAHRIDEQIAKALERKVWLPSGGSLIIDRTEAMTVVDVNTGKFTGSGGNLEETVTKNNLEAAEEIVRQLRLRDIGGIIVIDFIDMVLENNRDLVLRRLVECLGRDRTRHQVAEVTSLGLVQMTRKRIGTGLLEAFSESCEHCQGRGLVLHDTPVEPKQRDEQRRGGGGGGRRRGGKGGGRDEDKKSEDRKSDDKKSEDKRSDDQPAADASSDSSSDSSADEKPAEDKPARRSGGRRGSKRSAGAPEQGSDQPSTQPTEQATEPVLTGDASAP